MLACELIGIMNPVVTILAEGSFIGRAEYSRCLFPTNVTLNLHRGSFRKSNSVYLKSLNIHACASFLCVLLGVRV